MTLNKKDFHLNPKYKLSAMEIEKVEIIAYQPEFAIDFYSLNVAWLEKYFYVEPYDEKVLSNPQKHIIETGGYIFL